jgi:dienelactone hydrolase
MLNFHYHVLIVEYPNYGVYKGSPSGVQIRQDAEDVYSFLLDNLGLKEENIMIYGRSIGSGPATYLASRFNPSA